LDQNSKEYSVKSFIRLLAAVSVFYIATVQAQDRIIAKVNGVTITESQLNLAEEELGAQLQQLPPEQRKVLLLEYLIENQILAKAANEEKLTESENFKARMAYYRLRALRDTFYETNVRTKVSDTDVKKFYDAQIANVKPETEVRARHILVEKEDDAKELIKQLEKGADFEKLAKENSKGPSAAQGGDLGYFTRGRMVPEFDAVVFDLKTGGISAPVKTQFGWHVIKVEDVRSKAAPPLDALKDRIMGMLVQQKAQEVVGDMRKKAEVEVLDEELKKLHEELRGSFGG